MAGDIGNLKVSARFPLTTEGRTIHVHGTAAQAEIPDGSRHGRASYRGWGTVLDGYDEVSWLHVSLPVAVDWTQLLLAGKDTEALSVVTEIGADFAIDPAVRVNAVHLWDGAHRFAHWDVGDPQPKSLAIGATSLSFEVAHQVQRSLGLSIAVQFPIGFDTVEPASFTLIAAYAVLL